MSEKSPKINGKQKYARILIRRKRLGTHKEHAARLIAAGVPLQTADLSINANSGVVHTDHSLYQKQPEELLPAWSAVALMELLPIALETVDGKLFRLTLAPYGSDAVKEWRVAYLNEEDGMILVSDGYFFDAIVSMVEKVNTLPLTP